MGTQTTAHEYPTKCASKTENRKEQSDAVNLLVAPVPHAHIKDNSGDEPAIHDAEEETGGNKSGEVLGDARKGSDRTPDEGNGGQPKSWSS